MTIELIPEDLFVNLTYGSFDDQGQIVRNVADINRNHGVELYIALGHHGHFIEMIGCPDEDSLSRLAKHFDTFQMTKISGVLCATPLNPAILPFDIEDESQEIWIILDDYVLAEAKDMASAAHSIEILIAKWPKTQIEDFAVLVGKEVAFDRRDYAEYGNIIAGV
jgi:hypothetical protein